jgi:hypothetical protein
MGYCALCSSGGTHIWSPLPRSYERVAFQFQSTKLIHAYTPYNRHPIHLPHSFRAIKTISGYTNTTIKTKYVLRTQVAIRRPPNITLSDPGSKTLSHRHKLPQRLRLPIIDVRKSLTIRVHRHQDTAQGLAHLRQCYYSPHSRDIKLVQRERQLAVRWPGAAQAECVCETILLSWEAGEGEEGGDERVGV